MCLVKLCQIIELTNDQKQKNCGKSHFEHYNVYCTVLLKQFIKIIQQ